MSELCHCVCSCLYVCMYQFLKITIYQMEDGTGDVDEAILTAFLKGE